MTTAAEKLAALLRRKFPGPSRPNRTAPKWMPADLADVYLRIGRSAMIAPHHGRMSGVAECKAQKALMTRVDPRGERFSATWEPFTLDASGGMLCFDTKSGRLIYIDAPSTGNVPRVLAASVAAWMKGTTRALEKVPDPPDPDEDDYLEDEQEERFDDALVEVLLRPAKAASRPRPIGVSKVPPPPDASFPKAMQFFTTFEETKKHALDGLLVARGIGMTIGKTTLQSIGTCGGARTKSRWQLVFHHARDERNQGLAGIALMDAKRREGFVTFDDTPQAPVFVKEVDRLLKKLGFHFDVIDDPKHHAQVLKRWQKWLDG